MPKNSAKVNHKRLSHGDVYCSTVSNVKQSCSRFETIHKEDDESLQVIFCFVAVKLSKIVEHSRPFVT